MTAESGSPQDIQAAVDQADAAGGGTVYIPEGDFVFNPSGRTVTIPGGVSVIGAGKGKTILRNTVEGPDHAVFFYVDGVPRHGKSVRISGITFVGVRESHPDIPAGRCLGIEISEVKDFRVDHCVFKDLGGRGVGTYDWTDPTIICRGLIDNCEFVNTSGVPAGDGGIATGPNVIGYGIAPNGSARATDWIDNIGDILGKYEHGRSVVFVEDCYFRRWRHCIASNQGVHYVFRHNTIELDCGFGSIDCHGGGYGKEGVGTRAVEVYDNTIRPPAPGFPWKAVFWLRGGGGVIFNNAVQGYSSFVGLSNEGENEKYWPNDVWIWGNSLPGDCVEVSGDRTEGVHYFRHEPHTFRYKPYPYPHPLRGEGR